jgi:hypothetical protein
MEAVHTRRWCRLHWLTWLAVAIELAAIACLQSVDQHGGSIYFNEQGINHVVRGWPAWDFCRYEVLDLNSFTTLRFDYVWKAKPLLFNCFIWAFLTSSVGWLVETWLRRPNRLQFSLRGVAVFFAIVGAMLTLVKERAVLEGGIILMGLAPGISSQPWYGAPFELNAWVWAAVVVIFCSVSSSVWLLIHLASQATYRLLKCVNPTRA